MLSRHRLAVLALIAAVIAALVALTLRTPQPTDRAGADAVWEGER